MFTCSLPQTPVTYCAADTSDLERVVQHVKGLYADAPVLGAGVSLGGWVGEQFCIVSTLVSHFHGFLLKHHQACYCWITWAVREKNQGWWRVWPSRSRGMPRSPPSRWKNRWTGCSLTNTSHRGCVVAWSGQKISSLWISSLSSAAVKPICNWNCYRHRKVLEKVADIDYVLQVRMFLLDSTFFSTSALSLLHFLNLIPLFSSSRGQSASLTNASRLHGLVTNPA